MTSHPRYTLRELEASFIRRIDAITREYVDALADADGLDFLCPQCFYKNGGPGGTHHVLCWFNGKVDDREQPGPGRWQPSSSSTGIDDLTFVPHDYVDANGDVQHRTQSVLLTGHWHGYVFDGHVHTDGWEPENPPPEIRRQKSNPEYER